MTIAELQILIDLNCGNEFDVLNKHASWARRGYLFVDSENGQCYLFGENGKMDDIRKLKALHVGDVKKDIKKIVIPKGVKRIGEWAFYSCKSLKSIKIPDNVKHIEEAVFYNCISLTSIEIPNSVKNISNNAFWNCTSLKSIKISNSVESIGARAFLNCISLTSIEISESVESFGFWAFLNCKSLEEVIFKGKTIDQVNAMDNYPWGIKDESIIKCS